MGRFTGIKREGELKNKVAHDFFGNFDCTEENDNIDFIVRLKQLPNSFDLQNDYLLWAEAKKTPAGITEMLAQLVLTIGKARTFDKVLPPQYLGCFDCEKIAFIEYHEIHEIFYITDINWNVTSSNSKTKEFKLIQEKINRFDQSGIFIFDFVKDEAALKSFIKSNFNITDPATRKIQIDKKNFITIYNRWRDAVKPTICFPWEQSRRIGVIDGDFYLADLLSSDNKTLEESLNVLLKTDYYEADRRIDLTLDIEELKKVRFTDRQKAHTEFWAIYERPPEKEFWDYFQKRRDLLVPKDIRERKGSFFTPEIWVELSQKYIADVFGKEWQNEYCVWDCAAGTGNLLAGLTNKRSLWASTLDRTDVDIMRSRIKHGELNLLEEHCFQFDFLNDDFDKLPEKLRRIIKNTPEKLIVYINPPYAEDTNKSNKIATSFKGNVAQNRIHDKYADLLKKANHEIFVQFLIRIYKEMELCKIANFSTLKALCAPNFVSFRNTFQAKLEKLFVVPAYTFDNVIGRFPIGFHIWDTNKQKSFKRITADVFDKNGKILRKKTVYNYDSNKHINEWLKFLRNTQNLESQIGILNYRGNDFQHESYIFVNNNGAENSTHFSINQRNLIETSIYLTARKAIIADWLNDRDQFLYPNDGWRVDKEFQNDCLAYTLFHNSNNISSAHGVNHWIPFTEDEVNASDSFDSSFMTDVIAGRLKINGKAGEQVDAFEKSGKHPHTSPLKFSAEAKAVFNAGRELWRYYHAQKTANVNASFYDIREHFQGRNEAGKMNNKSEDAKYNELIGELRDKLKVLAKKIEPKIYEYGFLRE